MVSNPKQLHGHNDIFKLNSNYVIIHVICQICLVLKFMYSIKQHLGWLATIEELATLYENDILTLIPKIPNMNDRGSKSAFKTKLKYDGSLNHLKAYIIASKF